MSGVRRWHFTVTIVMCAAALGGCRSDGPKSDGAVSGPSASAATTTAPGGAAASSSTVPAVGTPRPELTEATEPSPKGRLRIRIVDDTNRSLPGVVVAMAGPEPRQVTTDAKGIAQADLATGTYDISVPASCSSEIQVTGGGTGHADVPPGSTVDGVVRAQWVHRFIPETVDHASDWARADGSSDPSGGSVRSWTPGVDYAVAFAVIDRCNNGEVAPNATVVGWDPQTSENTTVLTPGPWKTDTSGMGRIVARCSGSGTVILLLVDRDIPDEPRVDLLARSKRGIGRPSCSAS